MATYEVTVRFRVEAESVEEANGLVNWVCRSSAMQNTLSAIRGCQIEDTETHEIGPEPQ